MRQKLQKGDYVIFFCAKAVDDQVWEYYYVGLGTVDCEFKLKRRRLLNISKDVAAV